jgi:hypothetical protein
MTTEQMYKHLSSDGDLSSIRRLLKEYLLSQILRYERPESRPEDIANEIAGLMSTRTFEGLSSSDPLMEVCLMAGQLELPLQHRSSTATWVELKRLISQLH